MGYEHLAFFCLSIREQKEAELFTHGVVQQREIIIILYEQTLVTCRAEIGWHKMR